MGVVRRMSANIWWWLTHITPIPRKLITYAANDGHCARSPVLRSSPAAGMWISRTSSVMAMAKTPSAKVSSRAVSLASLALDASDVMCER